MVVKSKIGRRRYIVFTIESEQDITRKDIIYTFNRLLPLDPADINKSGRVLQKTKDSTTSNDDKNRSGQLSKRDSPVLQHRLKFFDGQNGILLCPHWLQHYAVDILNSVQHLGVLQKPVKIKSIGTSGTLKKARKKYLQ